MTVEVKCQQCTDDYEKGIFMLHIGSLIISEDKTQSQEYKCVKCGLIVMVSINTLENRI